MRKQSALRALVAWFGLSVALVTGCATPVGQQFQAVQLIPSDKGIVYVYYVQQAGGQRGYRSGEVLINDSGVGLLHDRDYMVFRAKPGPVRVSTGWKIDLNEVTVNVEPNGQYYVRVKGSIVSSYPFAPTRMLIKPEQVSEQEALGQLKEFFLREPTNGLASELWGRVTPGIQLSDLKSMYVDTGGEKWEAPLLLAERLRARGYEVKTGLAKDMPANTQCLVKVKEGWFWDLGSYLLTLEVELQNPQTNALYASAKVRRASPQGRRGPKVMVTEAMNAIFNGGMPEGVEFSPR